MDKHETYEVMNRYDYAIHIDALMRFSRMNNCTDLGQKILSVASSDERH